MTSSSYWPVDDLRRQFPALQRTLNGRPVIFLDGPAGSQVPQRVADAVSGYLLSTNANHGGAFATAQESDRILDAAHEALADFTGATDPQEICFGANMTTITFQVSRALSRGWQPGDEIIVCRGDHDANFTPWILAARDAGVTVKYIDLNPVDATLDLESLERRLSSRTQLVATGLAGNATGTINPVAEISALARTVDAMVYVDAVHFAPHGRIDVGRLGCDFLVCSAYKFFGPHVGVLWGKRERLEELEPYKLRPAPDSLPGRWMTGTQCHEGIAGAAAAVDYLASLGRDSLGESADDNSPTDRKSQLDSAMERITAYERTLSVRLLTELQRIPRVKMHGIAEADRVDERVPTISVTVDDISPRQLADRLAAEGIFVWSGNHYAQPFTEAAGLEPDGTLRLGALHYTTMEEIDRTLEALHRLSRP